MKGVPQLESATPPAPTPPARTLSTATTTDRAPIWPVVAPNSTGARRTHVLDCSDVEEAGDSEVEC